LLRGQSLSEQCQHQHSAGSCAACLWHCVLVAMVQRAAGQRQQWQRLSHLLWQRRQWQLWQPHTTIKLQPDAVASAVASAAVA
jgi:hypothetical protein